MTTGKLLRYWVMIPLATGLIMAQVKHPQAEANDLSNSLINMQWFLSYLNGVDEGNAYNEFALKRGYVNIKKDINDTFSGRITTDITVDREGDGEGDVEIRLKYLYLKYQLPSRGIFYKPYFEFGLVHRPWLDFEQHINTYRVQGTMFLERNQVISSGDYGIFLMTLFGDEMSREYRQRVNNSFAGTYGSFAIGIFNGGGYHALEKNENKSIESRLTIRPVHKIVPGLQFTYHGALGKGNIPEAPDWQYNSLYCSYEHEHLICTGEYYRGKGNYKGTAIQDTVSYTAVPQRGYSFFSEWKFFHNKISLVGRYDVFTRKFATGAVTTRRAIAGVAFHFIRNCKILVDYDFVRVSGQSNKAEQVFEVAVELKY